MPIIRISVMLFLNSIRKRDTIHTQLVGLLWGIVDIICRRLANVCNIVFPRAVAEKGHILCTGWRESKQQNRKKRCIGKTLAIFLCFSHNYFHCFVLLWINKFYLFFAPTDPPLSMIDSALCRH